MLLIINALHLSVKRILRVKSIFNAIQISRDLFLKQTFAKYVLNPDRFSLVDFELN